MSGVVVGKYYTLKPHQHVINEQLYLAKGRQFMVQQVATNVMVERGKKLVQFALISYLLS
jgi:hypothetical protein